MRDTPERDLAVAEDRLQMADDRIRELEERIRTLELACEAARKLFVGLLPELDRAEDVEAMIKRLEGATKNG